MGKEFEKEEKKEVIYLTSQGERGLKHRLDLKPVLYRKTLLWG